MAFLAQGVYDNGLSHITSSVTRMVICSQEPTTYAQANATYYLGQKTSYSVGSPAAGSPNGRQVTAPSVTDGSTVNSGTASAWALVSGSELIAAGPLANPQTVTPGNPWTTPSFTIRIPAAVVAS